jgi:hypothetical protein
MSPHKVDLFKNRSQGATIHVIPSPRPRKSLDDMTMDA